ncbi:MAG: RiPP maturation radical SAM C-methyltransferase [Proteobacteria bacterium]|nr:RiPP maturation radical SAM C-methyltransferase [Pseudomonadota bacterium]MBU1736549.1 RiPP maturation radical SAM C-methyltransferase [Pseudomonadota bacterium]
MAIDKAASVSGGCSIALVSMPWSIFNRPSIQLGVLKSSLLRSNPSLPVDCYHHYLQTAQRLGPETYHWLTLSGWAGEALYAPILFPDMALPAAALFDRELKRFNREKGTPGFAVLASLVEEALKGWIDAISWDRYGLIGFSVCFNQLLPSLAAARLIKERAPSVKVVFGGSACGGQAGLDLPVNFSQIDHVVRGEGELALVELVRNLQGGDGESAGTVIDCPANIDLEDSPPPDYGDYFREISLVFRNTPVIPVVPVEFSRGCWWGKCSFCNLNLQWCGYRYKSADRMCREVGAFAAEFGTLDFSFTDNVLPVAEARKFFRQIARSGKDFEFFAEIRATQTADLAGYRRGGLVVVQAGIEALSTGLLARMKKGVTAIENLAVMKEALKQGVALEGNLITEFPTSTEQEVAETLHCLDFALPFKPLTTASFFLGLESPVDRSPGDFGITAAGPHRNYSHLYPAEILRQQEMVVKDFRGSRTYQRRLWRPVVKRVKEWQDFQRRRGSVAHRFPLSFRDGGEFVIIRQEQLRGPVLNHRLKGMSRRIYLFCEEIRDLSSLIDHVPGIGRESLERFLAEMVDKRLMFREGEKVLSLAIGNSRKCREESLP